MIRVKHDERELWEGGFAPHRNKKAMTKWKEAELVDDETGVLIPIPMLLLMDEKEKNLQPSYNPNLTQPYP